MKIEILMPAMSPSMNEGDLTKWFIKVGDYLRVGDPIAEIQTDKAAMDIESDSEGTVIELLVQEGQEKIAVKTPIAFLDNNTSVNPPVEAPISRHFKLDTSILK
jgi:pyruvate dehydrogenase E1 component beta subunit